LFLLDDTIADYRTLLGNFNSTKYGRDFYEFVLVCLAVASFFKPPALKLAARVGLLDLLARLRKLGIKTLI